MHLLYLDDSGSVANIAENYIVLGGISIYEAQADYITRELDKLAENIYPAHPDEVEFHASEIFSRRIAPWKDMNKEEAQGVIIAVLKILANAYDSAFAFACAIHKPSYPNEDHLALAFEDLITRFDRYLSSLSYSGDRQRGLLILDDNAQETTLQNLTKGFRKSGTKWRTIKNLADVPLFCNSKASRIIQLADHIAYAVFRRYNASDTLYFDIIASKFYSSDGIIHGLAHKQKVNPNCTCPACITRRQVPKVIPTIITHPLRPDEEGLPF